MPTLATRLILGCLLAVLGTAAMPRRPDAQTIPGTGPPVSVVRATWSALWERLLHGDVDGARRYLHSSQQGPLLDGAAAADLRELARQMQFCRVESDPLPVAPDEVMYPVHCEHEGETAETLVGLRQDRDGSWRLVIF